MSKRSDKMYKDSPKITTAEDGKKVVTKGESKEGKVAERTDDGTDGTEVHEKAVMDVHHKHAEERQALHHKHEKEHMALHHSHMKELAGEKE